MGKSVVFTKLSGVCADSSNYAGTTVTYTSGYIQIENRQIRLIDVPGTYSLNASCEAEQVAADFLKQGAAVILCVLDATNLQQSIRLALELLEQHIPILFLLNLYDVAQRQGIHIDLAALQAQLGAKVIPTVAVKGTGLEQAKQELEYLLNRQEMGSLCQNCPAFPSEINQAEVSFFYDRGSFLAQAEGITRAVQTKKLQKMSSLDRLGELMIKPFPGIFLALIILGGAILAVIGGGELLIATLFDPLVEFLTGMFRTIFSGFIADPFWKNILIGDFGIFITSFEWILGSIFPYVLMFYAVFSFLEDCGYLPRLGVLFDNIMSRLGLQGGSIVTILLGYGCAVPAILGSRSATTRKERLIITAIVCFAVPCTSQTGALLRLFSRYAAVMVPLIVCLSFVIMLLIAVLLKKLIKGRTEPMLIEIPNLLLPSPKTYLSKLKLRMKHFFTEAELPMLLAIVLIAVIASSNLLESLGKWMSPLVVDWLGLPQEASVALVTGIIRREMAVAPLLSLNLTPLQTFVGGTVSLLYLPCLSVFAVLVKEFRLRTALLISVSTTTTAFLIGGLVNQIASLFVK